MGGRPGRGLPGRLLLGRAAIQLRLGGWRVPSRSCLSAASPPQSRKAPEYVGVVAELAPPLPEHKADFKVALMLRMQKALQEQQAMLQEMKSEKRSREVMSDAEKQKSSSLLCPTPAHKTDREVVFVAVKEKEKHKEKEKGEKKGQTKVLAQPAAQAVAVLLS